MIGRKSFLIVLSRYLIQIIGLIGVVILAKLWAASAVKALGEIAFAMSFLAIFGIISDLGFSQAHTKRVSEGKDIGKCLGTYISVKIILTALMVTIIFIALFLWKNVFNQNFTDATTESIIYVFILYYIFSSLSCIPIKTFMAKKETVKQQLPGIFGRSFKVVCTIVVAVAGVSTISMSRSFVWPEILQPLQKFISTHAVGSLAMTYVLDVLIIFLIGMWFLRKYPIKKPDWEYFKSYASYAMPVMLLSVIAIISLNVDRIMIGYFYSSKEVGYYFTVQKITEFIIILASSVSTLLFPTISELHAKNNNKTLNKITMLAERYISMIMIPPIVIIIVFVYPLINIMLDKSFLPAAPVLIVLVIYSFLFGMKVPYISLINGMNRPGLGAKIGIVICSINIPLNLLFIPKYGVLSPIGINGATGAAVATVISIFVGLLILKIYAFKLASYKISQTHTLRHLIAGFFMGFVLYLIAFKSSLFTAIHWYHLLIFSGLGLIIYIAFLYILNEFDKKDLQFFLYILHPTEIVGYIKSELRNKK